MDITNHKLLYLKGALFVVCGLMTAGDELASKGKRVGPRETHFEVTDGPFVESKEIISGYFIISAETEEEALAIAKECPHLDYSGEVEIVQVV